jgi:hypothetical protein
MARPAPRRLPMTGSARPTFRPQAIEQYQRAKVA